MTLPVLEGLRRYINSLLDTVLTESLGVQQARSQVPQKGTPECGQRRIYFVRWIIISQQVRLNLISSFLEIFLYRLCHVRPLRPRA